MGVAQMNGDNVHSLLQFFPRVVRLVSYLRPVSMQDSLRNLSL